MNQGASAEAEHDPVPAGYYEIAPESWVHVFDRAVTYCVDRYGVVYFCGDHGWERSGLGHKLLQLEKKRGWLKRIRNDKIREYLTLRNESECPSDVLEVT